MYLVERNLLPTDVKTETQSKELLKNFSKLRDTFLGHAAEGGKIKMSKKISSNLLLFLVDMCLSITVTVVLISKINFLHVHAKFTLTVFLN